MRFLAVTSVQEATERPPFRNPQSACKRCGDGFETTLRNELSHVVKKWTKGCAKYITSHGKYFEKDHENDDG